jgi:hypothetical protein
VAPVGASECAFNHGLLDKLGFDVLWIPGGNDQGIDIVAGDREASYLIDVKQYSRTNPVQVELVRNVYGVAAAVQQERPDREWHGGIITSSRFTSGANEFRHSARIRPLLKDGEWLRKTLESYIPRRVSRAAQHGMHQTALE